MTEQKKTTLNYWKIIPLSIVLSFLISLIAFFFRNLLFKGEISELMLTLTLTIIAAFLIGMSLTKEKRKDLG
jgi:hypothetical protein